MSTDLAIEPIAEALIDNNDFLNFTEATISLDLDYAALSAFGAFTLLPLLSPDLAATLTDLAADLPDTTGTITIIDGVLGGGISLSDSTFLETVLDLPATLDTFADLALNTNGSAELVNGIFTADITTGEESLLIESFDLATVVSTFALETINAIDTTVAIENGAFSFAEETMLGEISGTVDLGGGDLNIVFNTDFVNLTADIPFKPEAVLPFSIPIGLMDIDAEVDFYSGNIEADLGLFGQLVFPIHEIDGQLALADGMATFSTDVPMVGNVDIAFEVGTPTSEFLAEAIQDLTAAATITDGLIEASLNSELGWFETTFNVVEFTQAGADFFSQVDGQLLFDAGQLLVSLSTPVGDVEQTFDLEAVAGLLSPPSAVPA
jgi:hypothetical protein